MNRLDTLFSEKSEKLLSVYTVIGFPNKTNSIDIIKDICRAGADFVELGMPFSDPVADGPLIQKAHAHALEGGTAIEDVFKTASAVRKEFQTPLVAMGYFNPILQYGLEQFLTDAAAAGVDGAILPDLPPELYQLRYKVAFERAGIHPVFLISPNTPDERIKYIDSLSKGFIYAVSSLAVTGTSTGSAEGREAYLRRIATMRLRNPVMVGFGIKQRADFDSISQFARGGIIGSAFIEEISKDATSETVQRFIRQFR